MKSIFIKNVTATLVTTILVSLLFAGCGKETVSTLTESGITSEVNSGSETTAVQEGFQHDPILNEVGIEPISKEKVILTVMIKQNSNVENYDTNAFTRLIEEAANVELEFVEIPPDQVEEKIRLMAAADGEDIPDIIIHNLSDALVDELAANEMILPLDNYYENCSVYYKDGFERVKETRGVDLYNYIKAGDGHVYTVPTYNETLTATTTARIWVYQPWLDALGLKAEDIVTTEDFYNMLEAFKKQDPNGNGKADEIPALSYSIDTGGKFVDAMMSAFVRTTSGVSYLNAEDGKLYASYTQEGWKEGVKYVKSLIDAGLYDASSFTMNLDSFKTVMNSDGDQLVGCYVYASTSFLQKTHPSFYQWVLLSPLTGPEGVCTTPYMVEVAGNRGFISKNCEHPELAFRLMDLMGKEKITISSRWGIEGEQWNYIEDLKEIPKYKDVEFNETFAGYPAYFYAYGTKWGTLQNDHWANWNPSFRTAEVGCGFTAASLTFAEKGNSNAELAKKLLDYEKYAPEEKLAPFKYSTESLREATELQNSLEGYVKERLALWLTGAADVEKEWKDYLAQLEKLGLSRYLELAQQAYDRTK